MSEELFMLKYDIREKDSEISRHHSDFRAISHLCELSINGKINPMIAIYKIRNIVG